MSETLRSLYLEDPRPWLVGFSGGKDSTLVAALIFEVAAAIPAPQRTKRISVLCTDTLVEIPAIVEMIEGTLNNMRRYSEKADLNVNVDVRLLNRLLASLPRYNQNPKKSDFISRKWRPLS